MNESQKKLCEALWQQYELNLRSVCNAKLVGLDEDVSEILSETFLIMCKKVSQEDTIEHPKAWLYATLNNLIKQKYRDINRRKENICLISDCEQVGLPYMPDLVDEIFNEDMLEKLKDILETRLTDEEKQLLYYIIIDNKLYAEIAQLMASSESNIKQRKYRLFNKIKQIAKDKK